MPKRLELLDELRKKAFWFGIGNPDSPPIYAIVDPVCPYSAEAMLRLEDSVESGALQLRIILRCQRRGIILPKLCPRFSRIRIRRRHSGNTPSQWPGEVIRICNLGDYATLPAGIRAAARANSELASELEIPGVPFFAFRSSNGDTIYAGVPAQDQFANALSE